MKKIGMKYSLLLCILSTVLLTSCLVKDRAMTGVVVNNKTGGEIQVTVKYTTGENTFTLPNQIELLVVEDFAKGGSRTPHLHSDLESIIINDIQNIEKTITREQFLKEAIWEKKSRQWILTIE